MASLFTHARGIDGSVIHSLTEQGVRLTTSPGTDLWQRTFYGFQVANAPAALVEIADNRSFTVRAQFAYRRRYDQAGILLWVDEQNWFKAAIEHENASHGRLGSVLTTRGYSDWATRDVGAVNQAWFRLSRRGPDFLLEARLAQTWEQLRVFHVAALGDTNPDWASLPATDVPAQRVQVGVYACSPEESSFTADFDSITMEASAWLPHA